MSVDTGAGAYQYLQVYQDAAAASGFAATMVSAVDCLVEEINDGGVDSDQVELIDGSLEALAVDIPEPDVELSAYRVSGEARGMVSGITVEFDYAWDIIVVVQGRGGLCAAPPGSGQPGRQRSPREPPGGRRRIASNRPSISPTPATALSRRTPRTARPRREQSILAAAGPLRCAPRTPPQPVGAEHRQRRSGPDADSVPAARQRDRCELCLVAHLGHQEGARHDPEWPQDARVDPLFQRSSSSSTRRLHAANTKNAIPASVRNTRSGSTASKSTPTTTATACSTTTAAATPASTTTSR
ncbi:MAG: hypothetical protein U5Q44_12855 [Dehalococcoidia bacterium]|nr:hypothetical protein [Dehalococcoidia bacterium]